VEEFGDVGERVEVFLKLTLGTRTNMTSFTGWFIEGIEVDSLGERPSAADDLVDQIRGGVRDADAEPMPVDIEVSRFLTAAVTASRSAG